jgi:hypothetical protein
MTPTEQARQLLRNRMRAQLANEFEFFLEHQEEWLPARRGEFVLIGKQAFGGFYATYDAALRAGTRMFGLAAPFLIEEVSG